MHVRVLHRPRGLREVPAEVRAGELRPLLVLVAALVAVAGPELGLAVADGVARGLGVGRGGVVLPVELAPPGNDGG